MRRALLAVAILGWNALLASANDELSRIWSAPRASLRERADAVNRAFTNGTPMSVVVAALGTNYVECFSSARLWAGSGPEPPNTPWLSYQFGEDEVTIHTSATISEGPLKGSFTGVGYSLHTRQSPQLTNRIYIGQPDGAGKRSTPDTNHVLYLTTSSNLVSISNAVRIASGLRVGMPVRDVHKYMQAHGLVQTNVYAIGFNGGRTMSCPYPLAGPAMLMLDMHFTEAPKSGLWDWSAPVLDGARILSQGVDIITITLTNAP